MVFCVIFEDLNASVYMDGSIVDGHILYIYLCHKNIITFDDIITVSCINPLYNWPYIHESGKSHKIKG